MGKRDVKYVRLKCNYGTKCHTAGLANNAVDGMFTSDILPQRSVQKKSSGVDEQSVHLEIKCDSGCSEPWDVALGGRSVSVEMLPGSSKL
jgi:hypothetical protein